MPQHHLFWHALFLKQSNVQAKMVKENTTYVMKRDIDLKGATITLPKQATLPTRKCVLKKGKLVENDADLSNLKVQALALSGSYKKAGMELNGNADTLFAADCKIKELHITGNGYIVKAASLPIAKGGSLDLQELRFDCSGCAKDLIYLNVTERSCCTVKNCTFLNILEVIVLTVLVCSKTVISGNTFKGRLTAGSKRKNNTNRVIFVYGCTCKIDISGNTIRNCYGSIAIDDIGFYKESRTTITVFGNSIDEVSNGGIVLKGGVVYDVTITDNSISNTHYLGCQFDGERNGAENSALNFHGFHNADCP